MLTRLIYASHIARKIDSKDIEDILESSRRNNPKNAIGGMLYYGNGSFIQYIEGERSPVNDLYNRLVHDPRHKSVLLLDYKAIEKREFDDWSMGFVRSSENVSQALETITGQSEFRPEILDAGQADSLIKSLKTYLAE